MSIFETATDFWNKVLRAYLGTDDENAIRQIEDKAKIIGYTRIMRREIRRNGLNTEKGRAVIENSKKVLCELLPKVDTLLF